MSKILKLTAFKRIENFMNPIYIFATKFITMYKHLSLQERKKTKQNKTKQSRSARRANGLKMLIFRKKEKDPKRSIIYTTPEIPDQKSFESHLLHPQQGYHSVLDKRKIVF